MAIYPDARWLAGNDGGSYLGGSWRIVWHTTEVATAEEAFGYFRKRNSWPHFTVDELRVYQHVDTGIACRALEHPPGGIETNRWHAVSIEIVAQAALPKPVARIARAARLARWIEQTHGVPQVWPNGHPLPAKDGKDPGGHNRDPKTWKDQGGHYGHCHVPDNVHWDPGQIDIAALMAPDPPDVGDFPIRAADKRRA
jgi:hypothetical protein